MDDTPLHHSHSFVLRPPIRLAFLALAILVFSACGGSSDAEAPDVGPAGLTAEQMEKGIGPVSQVDLGDIDPQLVAAGEAVFTMKCSACHKMDERYVGPALGAVVDKRSPEYIMNMILNPAEMIERHPETRAMLAQFMTPMPNQNLTHEEARAILEYLRSVYEDDDHDDDHDNGREDETQ